LEFNKKGTKIHSRYKRFWSSLQKEQNFTLVGYSNVDFVGDIDDRISTSGYLMNMGSTTISWNYKKQTTIANSSAKAEYISLGKQHVRLYGYAEFYRILVKLRNHQLPY
jgi:hypothetical protein